jgi:hypothetical protein
MKTFRLPSLKKNTGEWTLHYRQENILLTQMLLPYVALILIIDESKF